MIHFEFRIVVHCLVCISVLIIFHNPDNREIEYSHVPGSTWTQLKFNWNIIAVTFGSGVSGGGRWPKLAEKRTSSSTDLLSPTIGSPEKRVTSMLLENLFLGNV